jgi:hypothetical protein
VLDEPFEGQCHGLGEGKDARRQYEKEIHIHVSGKSYLDRRFVDLPGYQLNDDESGSKSIIQGLLDKQRQNENTVVVCVGLASEDFRTSNLVQAIDIIYERTNFKAGVASSGRFVLALNKTDEWFQSADITASAIPTRLNDYLQIYGIVPILVGASVDRNKTELRSRREKGTAPFDDLVQELKSANGREGEIITKFLEERSDESHNLRALREFMGFENLLGVVDALVVAPDIRKLSTFSSELQQIADEKDQQIDLLKQEQTVLESAEKNVRVFVRELFTQMKDIMGVDANSHANAILADSEVREKIGLTAVEEEEQFRKGFTAGRMYSSYQVDEGQIGWDVLDVASKANTEKWDTAVNSMTAKVKNGGPRNAIANLDDKLLGGKVYDRALAVWAATAYSLLLPSWDDIKNVPNLLGSDPDRGPGDEGYYKPAKRLATYYVNRLIPAVEYLCRKVEFLMTKIFDVAWLSMMNKPCYARIAAAFGIEAFKREVKEILHEQGFKKSGQLAYNRAFFDLQNEIYKFLPFQESSPAVTAMKFAFPERASDIAVRKEEYRKKIAGPIEEHFKAALAGAFNDPSPSAVPVFAVEALTQGVLIGIGALAVSGPISPLVFVGLEVLKVSIGLIRDQLVARMKTMGKGAHNSTVDETALGFAVCMYAHFLPQFVASIDGRMRADLWESLKNTPHTNGLEEAIVKSRCVQEKKNMHGNNAERIDILEAEKQEVLETRRKLQSFLDLHSSVANLADESRVQRNFYAEEYETVAQPKKSPRSVLDEKITDVGTDDLELRFGAKFEWKEEI